MFALYICIMLTSSCLSQPLDFEWKYTISTVTTVKFTEMNLHTFESKVVSDKLNCSVFWKLIKHIQNVSLQRL